MIKLITHNDLDGIGCIILAKLFFKDIDYTICRSIHDVNECLKQINTNQYSNIYITDISCDEQYLINSKIKLFDHHQTTKYLNKYDNCTIQVSLNNRYTCGTELFYQYLLNKGLDNRDYFVELIRLYDTWEWINDSSKMPYYLNNLLYIIGITNFVNIYTEKLKNHDLNELNIFSERDRILLEYQEIQIQNYITNKKQSIYIQEVNINNIKRKIGICFSEQNNSILGNTLCNEENIDIMIMINLNYLTISFRTELDNIDVSVLAQKINLKGGGHKKAAGCCLPENFNDYIYNFIIDKIKD